MSEQTQIVARFIGTEPPALFAAAAWLQQHGLLSPTESEHEVILRLVIYLHLHQCPPALDILQATVEPSDLREGLVSTWNQQGVTIKFIMIRVDDTQTAAIFVSWSNIASITALHKDFHDEISDAL